MRLSQQEEANNRAATRASSLEMAGKSWAMGVEEWE